MAALEHALPLDHPALAPPALVAVPDPPTSGWPGEVVRAAEDSLAAHDFREARDLLADLDLPHGEPRLQFRAHVTRSWAEFSLGEIAGALEALEEARTLSERPEFGDVDRAEVLFQIGCCRLQTASVANAAALLTLALDLCNRSVVGCDHLRVRVLDWRSRCYQRQRDWAAARADVELALELAEQLGDRYVLAQAYFQASIITERQTDWRLARFYAEQSQALLEQLGDEPMLGKVLNNLGGLHFLLEDHDAAIGCLERAVGIAEARQSDIDIAYPLASLAQVQLASGDAAAAETTSRRAIALLRDRGDHLGELGGATLVCARALAAQDQRAAADELFAQAETAYQTYGSSSHLATVWEAQAVVAERDGDLDRALSLCRRALAAVQDVHF